MGEIKGRMRLATKSEILQVFAKICEFGLERSYQDGVKQFVWINGNTVAVQRDEKSRMKISCNAIMY